MYLIYLYFDSSERIVPVAIAETEELCNQYIKMRNKTDVPRKVSSLQFMKLSKYNGGAIDV